ncbi:MAG TPA: transglycosylase family protein [Acidimicrobiales bacterium]
MAAVAQAGGAGEAVLSTAQAEELVATTAARRSEAEARVLQLEAERDQIAAEHSTLTARQQELALELEEVKRELRQLAVTSYMSGGPVGGAERLLDAGTFNDAAWRAAFIDSQTERTAESAERYNELLAAADAQVRELVNRVDQNRAKLEHAYLDLFYASIAAKDAEQQLQRARARERLAVARAAAPGIEDVGGEDAWARLRQCESGGNYQAVSPSGRYRGAYQFDQRTWESVGGVGDPADAPPEEQDLRARILYQRSGKRPWPNCGRYLP